MKSCKEKQIDAKRVRPAYAKATAVVAPKDWLVIWQQPTAAETLGEGEVGQVDGDHQQVADRLQIRAAQVGAPPRGHLQSLSLNDLGDVLRSGEGTGDVHMVIMAAQQKIGPEIEVLFLRVTGILARKARP